MELTRISGGTKINEYPGIQNKNMDAIETHADEVDESVAALQATCLYVDSEGYLCLKEE